MPSGPAAANVPPGLRDADRFKGPTITEDLMMLIDLYRDLLALAVWRRLGARFPKEAFEINSPA